MELNAFCQSDWSDLSDLSDRSDLLKADNKKTMNEKKFLQIYIFYLIYFVI